jgi:hypothetical protein
MLLLTRVFVGSQTAIAAVTFIVIQILVFGSLFIRPAINLILGS